MSKNKLPQEIIKQHSHVEYPHTRTYYSEQLKTWFVVGTMNGEDVYAQSAYYADKATGLARKISRKITRLLKQQARQKRIDDEQD